MKVFSATFILLGFVAIEKENGKVVINLTIRSLETDVIWVYEVLFGKFLKFVLGFLKNLMLGLVLKCHLLWFTL